MNPGIVLTSLSRILRLLPKPFRLRGALVLALVFLNSLLDVLGLGAIIPVVMVVVEENAIQSNQYLAIAYDWFGFTSEEPFIVMMCLVLLVILMVKNLISIFITYYQSKFTFDLQAFFSRNLFRSFYARGLMYFKKMNSANILRNVNAVPSSFANGVVLPLMSLLNELIIISLILIGLLIYNFQVVLLLALIVGPTFGLFYLLTRKRLQRYQEELHEWSPKLTKVLFEAVYGFADVKITGTESYFFDQHSNIQRSMINNYVKANTFKVAPNKVIEFSMFLGVCMIIAYGVYAFEVRRELITLLGVFALAAYRVLPSVNRLMLAVMSIKSFEYTIEVMERGDAQQWVSLDTTAKDGFLFKERIVVKDLSFEYSPGEQVLSGVTLELRKGEVLGVIGESGSGKSTLMNLLLGFFPVADGTIMVDGEPLSASLLPKWQKSIGYVPQEVFMLDSTIRENVAFGVKPSEIDDELVEKCLFMASLKSVVDRLENGIYSNVGERGSKLSGGQKQRVGIARALYSGAQVLFFDEATSALDGQTEREITEAINKLSQNNFTMLIIAHRVTTLKYCDRIIELDSGMVKRDWKYDDLLSDSI